MDIKQQSGLRGFMQKNPTSQVDRKDELGKDQFQWKEPPYEYEYEKLPFDILCGTNKIRQQIESGKNPREIEKTWSFDLEKFKQTRKDYLLY